jgi:DNA repair exonuclease SbcCD ATPase subunit
MPKKKERTFAAKLAHEARKIHKKTCPVCGKETVPIVHIAALYSEDGVWKPQRRRVTVCDCNRKEIYG